MAATLAVEGAVLSHQCAAAHLGISPTSPSVVHVTVPGANGRRRRKGIVVHRSTTLTPAETTRYRGIPVTTHARTLRDLGFGPEPTRSHLERLFLTLCRRHGIPKPEVNVSIGPYTVDFLWRNARLIVETDGYRYHSGRAAFESDRARDRELRRRGYEVLRFAYREVTEEPDTVIASLPAHLHERSSVRSQT
jgi:very-short-patch-repair endonuclease